MPHAPWPTRQRAQGTLYHAFVSSPRGDYLLPLNEMRTRYPEMHGRHHAKFQDRESVLGQPVPPLGCTWGDVVFFSPVDSRQLFGAIRKSGRPVPDLRIWKIDAACLDPARTCIRLMRKSTTGPEAEPASPDDFLPFTTGTLRAVARVTDAALTRLRNLTPDEPLLPWVDVPHVLHRGPVPISTLTELAGSDHSAASSS